MSGGRDFIDRYASLERRVRALEKMPTAYMETFIVAGAFNASTEIPPFFAPFGGAIVSVLAKAITGNVEFSLKQNGTTVATFNLSDGDPTEQQEIDPPFYLDEADVVELFIISTDDPSYGLSVGVIIQP